MSDIVSRQLVAWRFSVFLLSLFGLIALGLAAVGLFGVLARSVAMRTHEIGLRMALGAQAKHVVRLVTSQGVNFALLGIVVGLGLAVGLSRLISSMLYSTGSMDPTTYLGVSLLFLVVALLACYVPAR